MIQVKHWTGALALLALAAPAGLAGLALAAPVTAASAAPAWTVDMAASKLAFKSSMGGTSFGGTFARWHADIHFDPKNLAGSSAVVKIEMASAHTGSSDRDEALPEDDWFATKKFAQATYAAKAFKDLGKGHYQAMGTLTMRGVTRPLVLPFTLQMQGKQVHMTGTTTIDRHVFGVGQGQFSGPESVPFNVQVDVSIAAKRV